MNIQFKDIEEAFPSMLRYQFSIDQNGLGILKFSGQYPRGSMGNGVGEFMNRISKAVLKYPGLNKLLVDLSELEYEWGNTIFNMVMDLDKAKIAVAIVYSEKCEAVVTESKLFFNNMGMALEKLNKDN